MNPFHLSGTKSTPEISLNNIDGKFIISGRSMPEDAFEFYKDAIQWMEDYTQSPLSRTDLEIRLEYFNSGSVKQVFTFLCLLEEVLESGKDVCVKWFYRKGDELMHQKGHEFVIEF